MFYDTRTHSFTGLFYAIIVVGLLLVGLLFVRQVAEVLDRPQVWVSHSTGECVEVKDFKAEHEGRESEWSCDNLPQRYEHVWVH